MARRWAHSEDPFGCIVHNQLGLHVLGLQKQGIEPLQTFVLENRKPLDIMPVDAYLDFAEPLNVPISELNSVADIDKIWTKSIGVDATGQGDVALLEGITDTPLPTVSAAFKALGCSAVAFQLRGGQYKTAGGQQLHAALKKASVPDTSVLNGAGRKAFVAMEVHYATQLDIRLMQRSAFSGGANVGEQLSKVFGKFDYKGEVRGAYHFEARMPHAWAVKLWAIQKHNNKTVSAYSPRGLVNLMEEPGHGADGEIVEAFYDLGDDWVVPSFR